MEYSWVQWKHTFPHLCPEDRGTQQRRLSDIMRYSVRSKGNAEAAGNSKRSRTPVSLWTSPFGYGAGGIPSDTRNRYTPFPMCFI
jgi:hypothetical protein